MIALRIYWSRLIALLAEIKGANRYSIRAADITQKKDCYYVSLQCFHSNTFRRCELSTLISDDELLSQIAPREIKLLMEIWFQKSELKKNSIAVHEEGIFVYSDDEESFYAFEEIDHLLNDPALMGNIDAQSAFLLGKVIGERKLISPSRKGKLFVVK